MLEGVVDVTGSTVKVDTTTELANLYELARRAKNNNNSSNAQNYYEQILVKDPSSWEANFYAVYYQSMNCKIAEIGVAASRITNCEKTVFKLIKENVKNTTEQKIATTEVAKKLISISSMLFTSYKNFYDDINIQIKERYVQEYANNCWLCTQIAYNAGDNIISTFGDTFGSIAAECWKLAVKEHNILNGVFDDKKEHASVINSYNEKIKKYDSTYQPPKTNMSRESGCFIATAIYGSYNCPQVWILRRYRDYSLSKTWYGRLFINSYYAISPTIVKHFGKRKWFVNIFKNKLDNIIVKLNSH